MEGVCYYTDKIEAGYLVTETQYQYESQNYWTNGLSSFPFYGPVILSGLRQPNSFLKIKFKKKFK